MLTISVEAFSPKPWPFAILRHNAAALGPRPDWRLIAGKAGKNKRVDWSVARLLSTDCASKEWVEAAKSMTSHGAWQNFYLPLFGRCILDAYPDIERKVGKRIGDWIVGRRMMDKKCDVNLDFQIGINTPTVDEESTVSVPHVDNPRELIGGLLYMREDGDEAGGDLRVLQADSPRYVRTTDLAPGVPFRHVATVPYGSDNGFIFMQSVNSVHDVTPRKPTDKPRLLVSLCAEMNFPLFEIPR